MRRRVRIYQDGGNVIDEQAQAIIQQYAELSGSDPNELYTQLQQADPEQYQQALQSMVAQLQQAQGQGQPQEEPQEEMLSQQQSDEIIKKIGGQFNELIKKKNGGLTAGELNSMDYPSQLRSKFSNIIGANVARATVQEAGEEFKDFLESPIQEEMPMAQMGMNYMSNPYVERDALPNDTTDRDNFMSWAVDLNERKKQEQIDYDNQIQDYYDSLNKKKEDSGTQEYQKGGKVYQVDDSGNIVNQYNSWDEASKGNADAGRFIDEADYKAPQRTQSQVANTNVEQLNYQYRPYNYGSLFPWLSNVGPKIKGDTKAIPYLGYLANDPNRNFKITQKRGLLGPKTIIEWGPGIKSEVPAQVNQVGKATEESIPGARHGWDIPIIDRIKARIESKRTPYMYENTPVDANHRNETFDEADRYKKAFDEAQLYLKPEIFEQYAKDKGKLHRSLVQHQPGGTPTTSNLGMSEEEKKKLEESTISLKPKTALEAASTIQPKYTEKDLVTTPAGLPDSGKITMKQGLNMSAGDVADGLNLGANMLSSLLEKKKLGKNNPLAYTADNLVMANPADKEGSKGSWGESAGLSGKFMPDVAGPNYADRYSSEHMKRKGGSVGKLHRLEVQDLISKGYKFKRK